MRTILFQNGDDHFGSERRLVAWTLPLGPNGMAYGFDGVQKNEGPKENKDAPWEKTERLSPTRVVDRLNRTMDAARKNADEFKQNRLGLLRSELQLYLDTMTRGSDARWINGPHIVNKFKEVNAILRPMGYHAKHDVQQNAVVIEPLKESTLDPRIQRKKQRMNELKSEIGKVEREIDLLRRSFGRGAAEFQRLNNSRLHPHIKQMLMQLPNGYMRANMPGLMQLYGLLAQLKAQLAAVQSGRDTSYEYVGTESSGRLGTCDPCEKGGSTPASSTGGPEPTPIAAADSPFDFLKGSDFNLADALSGFPKTAGRVLEGMIDADEFTIEDRESLKVVADRYRTFASKYPDANGLLENFFKKEGRFPSAEDLKTMYEEIKSPRVTELSRFVQSFDAKQSATMEKFLKQLQVFMNDSRSGMELLAREPGGPDKVQPYFLRYKSATTEADKLINEGMMLIHGAAIDRDTGEPTFLDKDERLPAVWSGLIMVAQGMAKKFGGKREEMKAAGLPKPEKMTPEEKVAEMGKNGTRIDELKAELKTAEEEANSAEKEKKVEGLKKTLKIWEERNAKLEASMPEEDDEPATVIRPAPAPSATPAPAPSAPMPAPKPDVPAPGDAVAKTPPSKYRTFVEAVTTKEAGVRLLENFRRQPIEEKLRIVQEMAKTEGWNLAKPWSDLRSFKNWNESLQKVGMMIDDLQKTPNGHQKLATLIKSSFRVVSGDAIYAVFGAQNLDLKTSREAASTMAMRLSMLESLRQDLEKA